MKFRSHREAMSHLLSAMSDILDSGYTVAGIDPANVTIRPDGTPPSPVSRIEDSEPTAPMPAAAAEAIPGTSGNTCVSCGGQTMNSGACEVCISCGSTSSCS